MLEVEEPELAYYDKEEYKLKDLISFLEQYALQ